MNTLRSTWRMVAVTTLLSLFCLGATFAALRAAEQTAAKPAPASAPAQTPANAEDKSTPAETPRAEEPPDLRESADNNVSFPVDI
jgi:hypothetical protein